MIDEEKDLQKFPDHSIYHGLML